MNDNLKKVMVAKYNAEIEDAKDITAEVDKLIEKMAQAEEKLAIIELRYGNNKAKKELL